MKLWKVLGLAGAVGVAASGVLVVRSERARTAYTPDEVRDQLHRRFAESEPRADEAVPTAPRTSDRIKAKLRSLIPKR